MKQLKNYWSVSIAVCLCTTVAYAQNDETNRISVSGRFGFNIKANFKGLNTLSTPISNRRTPNGDNYNYDNGYVLTDNTGNFGGQTWYWGYDDSAEQISGNNIVLSRSTLNENAGATKAEDDFTYGAEVVYSLLLSTKDNMRLGLELAGNWMNLSMSDNRTLSAAVTRTSYPFPFEPGTTPPIATPSEPYQGSAEGPGFVIGATPGEPTTTVVPGGASIVGSRKFDANLWGLRFGPWLEWPVNPKWKFSFSGGLAGEYVDSDVSWTETVLIGGASSEPVSGSDSASKMVFGFYVGTTVSWQFAPRWSAIAGFQFVKLRPYSHSYGGRTVELDMGKSMFATIGIGWNF
jgi:hypothetical protein